MLGQSFAMTGKTSYHVPSNRFALAIAQFGLSRFPGAVVRVRNSTVRAGVSV